MIFYWPLSALPPPNQVLYVHSFIRCQYNCIQTSTLTVNPATYMLYSIYPDDKVLIGSNKVIRTEFISQSRNRREKSGQYISIFSRRLFWQKQSITHIILGPPRQILQIIGSSDISSFEPLQSNWLWLEMTQPFSLIILSMLPCVKIPIKCKNLQMHVQCALCMQKCKNPYISSRCKWALKSLTKYKDEAKIFHFCLRSTFEPYR